MLHRAGQLWDFSVGADDALAVVFSCAGPVLSETERDFFKKANPFGFILFKRNCKNPQQVAALSKSLKEAVGRDCPVLIDQEGGRVQRLRPPHWRDYRAMKYYGDLYQENPEKALEELRFETLRLAEELAEARINVDCAPVLDVAFANTTEAIGDRAFSSDLDVVARLGLSVCRHLLKSGVTPVIKHIPGHGRALADSHHDLPLVEASLPELRDIDFKPFASVCRSDVGAHVWAMTAHIMFTAIDAEHPISVSPKGIGIIREDIGFKGFLLSDDLDMKALGRYGDIPERAKLAIGAGCDAALYCWADLKIMEKMAENLPKLSRNALNALHSAGKDAKWAV